MGDGMEKYDVVIIGGGLGSLTTATYLSKRLRNVAVFEEGKRKKLSKFTKNLKDKDNNKYEFKFYNYDLGGVHEGDLFFEYMKRCGLQSEFQYFDNEYVMVVDKEKRLVKRPNDFKNFKIYLVRRYPKQRDQVHRFFDDVKRHHDDYKEQKMLRLSNKEQTLPSALIEWGDLSLKQVLMKYFDNDDLIDEFSLVYDSIGIPNHEVNAYNYFIKWFDTFIDGSHFIRTSFDSVVKTFSSEISKSREKIFTNRKINDFVIEDNMIKKIIDTDGNEISAKHYVINMRIDDFVEEYVPENEKMKLDFLETFESLKDTRYINQIYLGLSKDAKKLGINEKHYLFSEIPDDEVRLLSIVNYKAIDDKSCKDGKGALLIEFLDDDLPRKKKLEQVINQVLAYFPEIEGNISASKIGNKRDYFGGVASKEYWKNKSVNDLFDVDDYSYVNPLENGYFIGSWVKPEAGISGMIQTGVEYGDMIDDLIYYGDDDDYFITHDELMNIIAHQFIPGSLGKQERNVQFFVGKDSYYIRTKRKNHILYHGVSDISDLIIIATNECLYDLSVGNTTLEKALDKGNFEYVGDYEFLQEVIEGFDMGIETETAQRYKYYHGKLGLKFMLGLFNIIFLSNWLGHFVDYVYVAPITLVLFGGISYWKYRKLRYMSVFEYVTLSLYLVILILSIIFKEVNTYHNSKFVVLIFAVYLLVTWLINRPTAYGFLRYDYRTDYTRTKLFKKSCGGVTFIWGILFLVIAGLSFTLDQTYSLLSYYLIIFGVFLSYYYPRLYVRSNIDD